MHIAESILCDIDVVWTEFVGLPQGRRIGLLDSFKALEVALFTECSYGYVLSQWRLLAGPIYRLARRHAPGTYDENADIALGHATILLMRLQMRCVGST